MSSNDFSPSKMATSTRRFLASSANCLCCSGVHNPAGATLNMAMNSQGLFFRRLLAVVPGGNTTMGHIGTNLAIYWWNIRSARHGPKTPSII